MQRWCVDAMGMLGVAVAVQSARASAQSAQSSQSLPTARLQVRRGEGGEGCRDQLRLADEVASRLGRRAIVAESPRVIEVDVSRSRGRWRAVIVLREPGVETPARRTLEREGASCAELDADVALAVTLAIDPNADSAGDGEVAAASPSIALQRTPPGTVVRPTGPVARAEVPSERPRVAVPTVESPQSAGSLELAWGAGAGTTPWSGWLGLGVEGPRLRWFRPWITASRSFEARVGEPGGTGQFGFSRTGLSAGACIEAARDRWALDGCASLLGGLVTAIVHDARAYEPLRPGDHPWLSVGLSARGVVRVVGPVGISVGATASVAILRQRFAIEGRATPLFEQSVLGVDGWGAVSARFR